METTAPSGSSWRGRPLARRGARRPRPWRGVGRWIRPGPAPSLPWAAPCSIRQEAAPRLRRASRTSHLEGARVSVTQPSSKGNAKRAAPHGPAGGVRRLVEARIAPGVSSRRRGARAPRRRRRRRGRSRRRVPPALEARLRIPMSAPCHSSRCVVVDEHGERMASASQSFSSRRRRSGSERLDIFSPRGRPIRREPVPDEGWPVTDSDWAVSHSWWGTRGPGAAVDVEVTRARAAPARSTRCAPGGRPSATPRPARREARAARARSRAGRACSGRRIAAVTAASSSIWERSRWLTFPNWGRSPFEYTLPGL